MTARRQDAGREADLEQSVTEERIAALNERFTRTRGGWAEMWANVIRLSPDLFGAYIDLSGLPWRNVIWSAKIISHDPYPSGVG